MVAGGLSAERSMVIESIDNGYSGERKVVLVQIGGHAEGQKTGLRNTLQG